MDRHDAPRRLSIGITSRAIAAVLCVLVCATGCGRRDQPPERAATRSSLSRGRSYNGEPLIVLHAGSLAGPLRVALDSFAARQGIPSVTLSAGSLEAARRITELHDIPDLIAVADAEVLTSLLMPRYVRTAWTFATNRIVIAVGNGRQAVKADSSNWYRALSAKDVEVGRSDPNLDPAGYRALMVLRLAERAYRAPWIERAVLARSPSRNMRPKSSDLIALLQTGALDYAFVYVTSARAAGLQWIELPASINLGSDSLADEYARVSVRVAGRTRSDSIDIPGAPIHYAMAVPLGAPHPREASLLAEYLLSPPGLAAMHGAGLDVMEPQVLSPEPMLRFIKPRPR